MKKKQVMATALVTMMCVGMMAAPASAERSVPSDPENHPIVRAYDDDAVQSVFTDVAGGTIMGYKENGIYTFKGVKYGEVLGRWQEATPVQPWDNWMNACFVGPQSPQANGTGEFMSNPGYNATDWSEKNTLTLNIWSPDMQATAKKPVIVFVHGGGLTSGSGSELLQYDGHNMAEFGDVVFVTVNHRLNWLGYMDVSAYGEQYAHSGNLGQADLVYSLQWIHDNITAFGGDPDNVTVVGQSGGSQKVSALMMMPSAQGLFKNIVAMSAGMSEITRTKEEAQAETKKLIDYLGIGDLSNEEIMEKLTAMSWNELNDACTAAGVSIGIAYDNDFMMQDFAISAQNGVNYVVGTTFAEFSGNSSAMGPNGAYRNNSINKTDDQFLTNNRLFVSDEEVLNRIKERYGDKADAFIAAFQKAYPDHDLFDSLYVDRSGFRQTALKAATRYTQLGGTAYQYVTAYNLPIFGGCVSWHTGGDIGFLFRNLNKMPEWVAGDEVNADRYSRAFAQALVNLAYNGDPSQTGLAWPKFTEENHETMIFDVDSEVRNNHDTELMEIITSL